MGLLKYTSHSLMMFIIVWTCFSKKCILNDMKKILSKRNQKGFTLIELLIVVAIISVLSTTLLGNFQASRQKARDIIRMADLRTLNNAILAYIADHGEPPFAGQGVAIVDSNYTAQGKSENFFTQLFSTKKALAQTTNPATWAGLGAELAPYLSKMPKDPCGSRCTDASGNPFSYVYQTGSDANANSGNLLATDNDYSIYTRGFEGKSGNFGFSTAIITSF